MITVEFTQEQAQLMLDLIHHHKLQTEKMTTVVDDMAKKITDSHKKVTTDG